VKAGERVLEAGYANQPGGDGAITVTFPQSDLRFGVGPNLEIGLLGPSYEVQTASGGTARGFQDPGIDAKYEWWHDASGAFATDLILTYPTGVATFTGGTPAQTLNLNFGTAISDKFGFGTTIGVQRAAFSALLPSVVVTNQFEDRAQFYAEAFASMPIRGGGTSLFGLDGGIQFLLAPSLEIDAELGQTVTGAARAHYAGFGFGLRF
jgi:hypothetical protein